MQADAVPDEALNVLTVRAPKAFASKRLRERLFLVLRAVVEARKILRCLGRPALREVDDVDGRATTLDERFRRLLQEFLFVRELERHGALTRAHGRHLHAG